MLSKFESARTWDTTLDKPATSRSVPLDEFKAHYRINMSPKFQRGRYRHDEEFATQLLNSIITYCIIMPVLLYKLHPSDKDNLCDFNWEAIDGAHRIMTILQFMAGKYIQCEKGRKIMPYIFHAESKTHLFYQKTEETEEWANDRDNKNKRISYMTPEERERFNRYELQLSIITTPLTLEQRRREFLKIQINLPVKNNDLYKNFTQIPIIKVIMDSNIDEMFYDICKHLDKDITQYTTQWLIRFWLISKGHQSPSECMSIKDGQIKTMLEMPMCTALLCSTEKHELFIRQFERFHNFFDEMPDFIKLSPVAIYAIFNYLCNSDSDKDEIIMSHMISLYSGESKDERKMWEPKNSGAQLMNYFNLFSDKLNSLKILAPPEYVKEPRKAIPKKVRDEVWKLYFDTEDIGKCFCCNKDIFQKGSEPTKTWNCGHVVSDHHGGETTVENMRPVCFGCNQLMKTQNMMLFKSTFYPQAVV